MDHLGNLAVGSDLVGGVERSPLFCFNACNCSLYRAVLHRCDTETTSRLTVMINHLSLIESRVAPQIKLFTFWKFRFAFLHEQERPTARRFIARPKFKMHARLMHIAELWLIAFHLLVSPFRFPLLRFDD